MPQLLQTLTYLFSPANLALHHLFYFLKRSYNNCLLVSFDSKTKYHYINCFADCSSQFNLKVFAYHQIVLANLLA